MNVSNLFRTENTIRFFHTDPAAIVYYPKYFDMFQRTIEDWFTMCLGIDYSTFILSRRVALPTVNVQCDFILPCRLGEHLEVFLILRKIGTSSINLILEGRIKGEVRLRGSVVIVTIDLDKAKAVAIPDDLRAKLLAYQQITA